MANSLNTEELRVVKEIVDMLMKYKDAILQVAQAQNTATESQEDAVQATEELTELEKKRLKLLQQLEDAQSDAAIANEELNVQLQEQRRANRQAARESQGLISAYDKEKARLKQLRQAYRDLAVQGRANTQEAENLRTEINQLDGSLREIDSTIGSNRFGELTDQLAENNNRIGDLTDRLSDMPGPLGGIADGFVGMTKAALKFIATPIGAILTAIVLAAKAIIAAFRRNEDSSNALKIAISKLTGVFNGLLNALQPVVNFIVDNVVKAFDTLGKVANFATKLVSKGLRDLGFEKAADSIDKFTEKLAETSEQAEKLAKLEAELRKEQRLAEKIQLDYQKRAEKLRQIRDDEARSIFERIDANEQLGKVLQEQLNEELKIANKALEAANLAIKVRGESTENLDTQAEALTRISDIQERIAGQESEQLVNTNSLIKEKNEQLEKLYASDKINKFLEELEAENLAFAEEIAKSEENLTKEIEKQEEDRLKATIKAAEERVKVYEAAEAEIRKMGIDSINQLFELRASFRDQEISALEKQRDYEVALAEEKGENTAAIEEKFAKKEQELRKKQAIQEKLQRIFNATITIAEGIIRYASNPVTAPLAIPFAALGAFQLGTIIATPLPKFEHGGTTKKDGWNIVSEGGQELGILPGGNMFLTPPRESQMYLPEGTQIFPNYSEETQTALRDGTVNTAFYNKMLAAQDRTTKAVEKIAIINKSGNKETETSRNSRITRYTR